MAETTQKTVLIGVTGGVAAYKACEIVRGLQKAGVRVKVVMTEHATEFVGPSTFRALTREPVAVGLFDAPGDPIHHVSLAQECDVFVVAPATANAIAKMAHGIADDLFSTTALACKAPLVVAPAMNVSMYEAPATQENLRALKARGARIVDADSGYLACGDVGRGRLAEPSDIVDAVLEELEALDARAKAEEPGDLAGMRVLVTAGPTFEPIDPVRFLGNRSSGKMGFAVAEAAARRGAEVVCVSGPVALEAPAGVRVVRVETACEMLEAARESFVEADIAVFAAAVADMRPAAEAASKLKKGRDGSALQRIELVENPDILKTCASGKRDDQVVVGFAAETDDVVRNARAKLERKGADFIVANRVSKTLTFGADESQAWFIGAESERELPPFPKRVLADAILDEAKARLGAMKK